MYHNCVVVFLKDIIIHYDYDSCNSTTTIHTNILIISHQCILYNMQRQ